MKLKNKQVVWQASSKKVWGKYMFIVLYRWRTKEGMEEQLIENWSKVTEVLYRKILMRWVLGFIAGTMEFGMPTLNGNQPR